MYTRVIFKFNFKRFHFNSISKLIYLIYNSYKYLKISLYKSTKFFLDQLYNKYNYLIFIVI